MSVSREATVRHPALRSTFPVGRFVTPRACNDNVRMSRPGDGRASPASRVGLGMFVAAAWGMGLVWIGYQIALWAGL